MKNKQVQDEKLSLNRRTFLGSSMATSLSLMAGSQAVLAPQAAIGAATSTAAPHTTHEGSKKAWAKEHLRGGESFILPSMKSDLTTLDEEGLRNDVRHSIAQGFCSIMPVAAGLDPQSERSMQAIITDEAKGKILTVGVIRPGKWEDMADNIRYMESIGISHALMYFNPKLSTQEAMYSQMHAVIEQTSLGIILYAKPSDTISKMDPTGLPMDAFSRLADLDKVVGVKFTQELRPATSYAVAERLGDRLLMGVVDLELMLPLSLKYKMQWTGQWGIDSLQSPKQPWVNQFLNLLRTGKQEEAYALYWRYEPIATAFYELQQPSLSIGGHPWLHIKYMKWLTGGNGGLLPDLKTTEELMPHLTADGRKKCRDIFARVGIKTVNLPDDAFVVGNAAYEKGIRPKDLPAMPQYIA